MSFSKSEINEINKAFTVYCQLYAEKYKDIENKNILFSSDFENKMQKLINRNKKPYFRLINTAAKRIAVIIVAIIIALTSTALSVNAIRQEIKNFVIETFEKFSTVFFNENQNHVFEIMKKYKPDTFPEGFKLSEEYTDEVTYKIKYNDKNGNEILYLQRLASDGLSFDNENGNIEEINNGVYVEEKSNNIKMYLWSDGTYKYSLHAFGNINKEELLKMAKSLEVEK